MKLNENIAYAKSILNKNGITKDSDEYQDYLKIREICGRYNGYVGILTKLRFLDDVDDMDEIQSIFDVLRNSKIDINKLNKLSYNDILDMFYEDLTSKVDKSDIELYYKDDQYSYYRVYTYKGILKIGSPSWCLKTKSNWDQYQNAYPEQWVAIDNRHKGSLISPDNNYLENYSNTKKVWVRYGVSLKHKDDNIISWTANDDNNGEVSIKPQSWTFFGVMNTVLNLTNGNKKSYYDSFIGCKKVNNVWHKVEDKNKFTERLRLSENTLGEEDEVYVTFSKSYSFIPVILILNNYNFHFFFPTDKKYENNAFTKPGTLSGKASKQIIFDYIKDKDDIYFDGIKLKNNMITLEDVKNRTTKSGRKQFVGQFDKWLIYDRNKNYYLIVNTDVDEIEVQSMTINKLNDDMNNPMAWFLDKKTMKPWKSKMSTATTKDYHIEVIDYIKSNIIKEEEPKQEEPEEEPKKKKVKSFWNFFKK